jgi:hypothetical protein
MKIYCAYLPQFHPTKRNDLFWGKGFTDWVTTRKAKKLYKGHKQPLKPGNLKEYNLLDKKILKKHSSLMSKCGIDAFALYHYHFDNNIFALNEPLKIIKKNKDIKFKFFLYWVNSDWTKSWIGEDKKIIFKQNNSLRHALSVIKNSVTYFKDSRYEKIDDRPLFAINDTSKFDIKMFKEKANKILKKNGVKNLFIIANLNYLNKNIDFNFCDAVINWPPDSLFLGKVKNFLRKFLPKSVLSVESLFKFCCTQDYKKYLNILNNHILSLLEKHPTLMPTFMTNWDNTPRYGVKGFLLENVQPKFFYKKIAMIIPKLKEKKTRAIFIKAWNEWAEGNVIENSARYKDKYMDIIKKIKEITL